MLALIKPNGLFLGADSQADDRLDDHKDDEGHHATVYQGRKHCNELSPELARIAVQQALARLVDGRVREHACQERTDSPADAVDAESVKRVIVPEQWF